MNLSALALFGIGGYLLYAYYYGGAAGGGGTTPGAGSGSGVGSGTPGAGSGGGTTPGAGSGGSSATPPASGSGVAIDARPLAAAGNPQWIAVVDQSGVRQTYDQWAWYWNSVRAQPLTGAEMDAILVAAGRDRNTPVLASEFRAAVDAAAGGSAWET